MHLRLDRISIQELGSRSERFNRVAHYLQQEPQQIPDAFIIVHYADGAPPNLGHAWNPSGPGQNDRVKCRPSACRRLLKEALIQINYRKTAINLLHSNASRSAAYALDREPEYRTSTGIVVGPKPATVLLHDTLAHGQSYAHAIGFGRDERLK